MGEFYDYGMPSSDEGGADSDAGQATPQINGGLLDPRTFPAYLLGGAQPGMPPQTGGDSADTAAAGVHAEVEQDIQKAQAALGPADHPQIARQASQITGPLMTDPHLDALQSFLNAQAGLPPVRPHPETWSVNGQPYYAISASTFDPARSSGVTSMPMPDESAIVEASKSSIVIPDGGPERGGAIARLPNPLDPADADPRTGLVNAYRTSPVFLRQDGAKTGQTNSAYTLSLNRLDASSPLVHWHPDDSGMVDSASDSKGFGDTASLSVQYSVPTATVAHNHVGWHVLDNGQLKFLYPAGSMTSSEIRQMQQNLDQEQNKFLRPK